MKIDRTIAVRRHRRKPQFTRAMLRSKLKKQAMLLEKNFKILRGVT